MNWDDTTDTDAAGERLVGASADGEDQAVEAALRPKDLGEFIGQEKVREQLDLVLRAARARGDRRPRAALRRPRPRQDHPLDDHRGRDGRPYPHHLRPGHPARRRPRGDPLLPSRRARSSSSTRSTACRGPPREMLYMAMEDFRVDVIVGKGPGATAIPLELPPFTLVGATTRAGLLPPRCATASASPRTWSSTDRPNWNASSTARRACSTSRSTPLAPRRSPAAPRHPRIANRLLRRVRDYAQVKADGRITQEIAAAALAVYEVDARGLDRLDRGVLEALLKLFGGGPVGLSTLAVAVGRSVRQWKRSPNPSS